MDRTQDLPLTLPHDRDAEMSLVASALADNSVILEVAAFLHVESFHDYAHQLVWKAIVDLHLARDKQADPVTVWNWLVDHKAQADVGGVEYLVDLCQSYSNPSAATHYAEIIRDFAIRRALLSAGDGIKAVANDRRTEAMDAAEQAEKLVFGIIDKQHRGNAEPLSKAIDEASNRLEKRINRTVKDDGVLTGWTDLDSILGSMENGAMIVVAARPGMGKTAFALNILYNVASRGEHVFMASLEMKRIEIADRLISMKSNIDGYQIRKGRLDLMEQERAGVAASHLKTMPWLMDDTPEQSVLQIAAAARRSKMKHGTRLVMIDYMQLIKSDEFKSQRQEQVAAISRRIKIMARELNIPVMVLAQVNRKSEDRVGGRIKISDLRESGAVEQDADVVMLLQHDKEEKQHSDVTELEIEVGKNRNGPTGDALMVFAKNVSTFLPRARGASPSY